MLRTAISLALEVVRAERQQQDDRDRDAESPKYQRAHGRLASVLLFLDRNPSATVTLRLGLRSAAVSALAGRHVTLSGSRRRRAPGEDLRR